MNSISKFERIIAIDFEFATPPGEVPGVNCMVAYDICSKRWWKLDQRECLDRRSSPFPTDPSTLLVCFYATAELNCFKVLGWEMPARVIDLFVLQRALYNGLPLNWLKPDLEDQKLGRGLNDSLLFHGLHEFVNPEKKEMQQLSAAGGPFDSTTMGALIEYCTSDVAATAALFGKLAPKISQLPKGLDWLIYAGAYQKAVSSMEIRGVPIDYPLFTKMRENWEGIKKGLIEKVNANYGVFEGGSFSFARFANYLKRHGIPWERTATGRLKDDADTWRNAQCIYPGLVELAQLKLTLRDMRTLTVEVGEDSRNRCMLSVFSSITSRNQPSTSKFIFGNAAWLRGLIRPPKGRALIYCDYTSQEPFIAAVQSGDANLMECYLSGDIYLSFAKMAGAAPEDATKTSHSAVRNKFKTTVLALQYGQGIHGLAKRLNICGVEARHLIENHKRTFSEFWGWNARRCNSAWVKSKLVTPLGWALHLHPGTNPRTVMNFPMQATGADILRQLCIQLDRGGFDLCAPIHDAVLVECDDCDVYEVGKAVQDEMVQAAATVLGDDRIKTDAKIVCHPDRYMDERGETLWPEMMRLLETSHSEASCVVDQTT